MSLSSEQNQAMRRFMRNARAVAGITGFGTISCGMILFLLYRAGHIDLVWLGPALVAVGWLYPMIFLSVMSLRTGLVWHLLHGHTLWVVGALTAILLDAEFLGLLSLSNFEASALVGTMGLLMFVFHMFAARPAEAERERYGNRWLKLGQLSFWAVLFFRVPHEHI